MQKRKALPTDEVEARGWLAAGTAALFIWDRSMSSLK